MKLTKQIALMLAAILALSLPLAAMAEELDTELEGFVTELVEGGFLMEDKDLGLIMLNVDEKTVLDGILLEEEIAVGQYVLVQYDGRTTRSIPPQAHADKVGCYLLGGIVKDFPENGVMLMEDELYGDVLVHLDEIVTPIYPHIPVTVYYNGVMALSLPGQVAARAVIVPELSGTVSKLDEDGFTLTDAADKAYRVLINDSTLVGHLLPVTEAAAEVQADEATETLEALAEQASAEGSDAVTLPELSEEMPLPDSLLAVDYESPLANGDVVTVYYNGELSKDELPQLTALEVLAEINADE